MDMWMLIIKIPSGYTTWNERNHSLDLDFTHKMRYSKGGKDFERNIMK